MRGRKPLPTELHRLKGSFNVTKHGRDRTGEPIATGALLGPPDWMSESQQESWRFAVQNAPTGILKQIDRGILTVWIVAEDDHRTATMAQAALNKEAVLPMLTKDKNSSMAVSPYQHIKMNSALLMVKAASELGFTPAARPRLATGADGGHEASEWDELRQIVSGNA